MNKITIELSAEDRALLNRIADNLEALKAKSIGFIVHQQYFAPNTDREGFPLRYNRVFLGDAVLFRQRGNH